MAECQLREVTVIQQLSETVSLSLECHIAEWNLICGQDNLIGSLRGGRGLANMA